MPIRRHAELSSPAGIGSILFNDSEELPWVFSLHSFYTCTFLQALAEILKFFLLKFHMKYGWMIEQTRRLKSKETRGSIWMYNFYTFFKLTAVYFICYTMHMLWDFQVKIILNKLNKLYFFYLRSARLILMSSQTLSY